MERDTENLNKDTARLYQYLNNNRSKKIMYTIFLQNPNYQTL